MDATMPDATSLRELLIIRHANRQLIDEVNGNLGSALGRKRSSDPDHPDNGKPAILVFVPQKIAPKWLPSGQVLPARLQASGGLECPVDIVEGDKHVEYEIAIKAGENPPGTPVWAPMPTRHLFADPSLGADNLALREELRGWADSITSSAQLAAKNAQGSWFGTLGCFARDRHSGQLGLVTNQHVAGEVGQDLYFASTNARLLGRVDRTLVAVEDEQRFVDLVDEQQAYFRVDCAFAPLDSGIGADEIDFRVPVLDQAGAIRFLEVGAPVPLNLDSMEPIGQRVIGVGRMRSFQRGTIVGFAYEFRDAENLSYYTDYLIVGDEPDQFSAPGDSGKLILTDEDPPRPIALLWGGWQERLANRREQQDWTYGIDINMVLDLLNVDIAR